jgi:hypothetical protein
MNRMRTTIGVAILVGLVCAPAARAACNTPVAVGVIATNGTTFTATLTNSSESTFKGYFNVEAGLKDGSTEVASLTIGVPAGGSTTVTSSFAIEISTIIDAQACNKPGGITETPDPVIVSPPPPEETREEN